MYRDPWLVRIHGCIHCTCKVETIQLHGQQLEPVGPGMCSCYSQLAQDEHK